MIDIKNTNELRAFYEKYNNQLKARAEDGRKINLDKYMNPLSSEHIERYNKRFGITFNPHKNYSQFVFARFVESLFNRRYRSYLSSNTELMKELAIALGGFDVDKYQFIYEADYKALEKSIEGNPTFPTLNRVLNNAYRKEIVYRGVHTIAQFIKKQKYKNPVKKQYSSFDEYFKDVSDMFVLDDIKKLYGIGFALFADAIKEAGIIDIVKPDLHIVNILNEEFRDKTDKEFKIPTSMNEFKKILEIFYELAKTNNKTIYDVDKVLWMVRAKRGNEFYLD